MPLTSNESNQYTVSMKNKVIKETTQHLITMNHYCVWRERMKSKKYKKEIIKLVESHNFELIRKKKHLVFAHKITNRRLVCPATTDCQRVFKNTLASIKLHEDKYLLQRVA